MRKPGCRLELVEEQLEHARVAALVGGRGDNDQIAGLYRRDGRSDGGVAPAEQSGSEGDDVDNVVGGRTGDEFGEQDARGERARLRFGVTDDDGADHGSPRYRTGVRLPQLCLFETTSRGQEGPAPSRSLETEQWLRRASIP